MLEKPNNTPPLLPAPDRETRDSYSSITVDSSKDLPSRYSLDSVQTDWTNEKHGLYLDSLEASFVNKLYQSRRLRALCSQQKKSRKETVCDMSSSQLMVLQDGSCRNVNIERNDPLLDSTADSSVILEGPWMNHFASKGKSNVLEECGNCSDGRLLRNMSNSSACTRSSQQFPTRRCDSVAITREVSDQNFVGNHQRELSGSVSIAKRLKKAVADSSSNDQVVPFQRLLSSPSDREKQNAQLPSEHPKNFVPPKSDLCYHLRGS